VGTPVVPTRNPLSAAPCFEPPALQIKIQLTGDPGDINQGIRHRKLVKTSYLPQMPQLKFPSDDRPRKIGMTHRIFTDILARTFADVDGNASGFWLRSSQTV